MDPLDVAAPSKPFFDEATGAWMVSRYSEVSAALRDPRLQAGVADPDWHARYRQEAMTLFGAASRWHADIEEAARSVAPRHGKIDVVTDVVKPWAMKVACIVTGLPGDRAAELRPLTAAIFASAAEPFDQALKVKSDDATRMLAAHFSGEFASLFVQAFVALSESLAAFVVNAWYTLVRHDTDLVNIEELLRYASPSKAQMRRAIALVRVDDADIPAGASVMLNLASANRDPAAFIEPGVYDPQRSGPKHLAFGSGPHSCLGANLIRAAASVGLSVFFSGPRASVAAFEVAPGVALRSMRSLVLELPS
jgi:cytochrome P450